jgi:lysophospholipase L1-like esterase
MPMNKCKQLHIIALSYFISLILVGTVPCADAENSEKDTLITGNMLKDYTGDSKVLLMGFGDSITFGVGDAIKRSLLLSGSNIFAFQKNENVNQTVHKEAIAASESSADEVPVAEDDKDRLPGNENFGYLKRFRDIVKVATDNEGVPGERLAVEGIYRFPNLLLEVNPDITIFLEGANDATFATAPGVYEKTLQKAVNIARSQNRQIVLLTIPPPCCNREGIRALVLEYNQIVRNIASANSIRFADVERAWNSTCQGQLECELLNLPDGLHPNKKGYDVIFQTVAATLYDINIFSDEGAANLAAAIGVDPKIILVKPEIAEGAK